MDLMQFWMPRQLVLVLSTHLDDDAKLGALARVPVGSDIVLKAVGKLAWERGGGGSAGVRPARRDEHC